MQKKRMEEHLLLRLIREGEGLAGRVLAKPGIDLGSARREVRARQDGDQSAGHPDGDLARQFAFSVKDA